MTCNNCGAEVQDGMKFCFDCGTPVPQVKKCVSCGAELSLKMKFCLECGTNQDGSTPKSSGFSMGDKNVIAGDVIGSKEETHISGNATIIKNEDQTKQVKKCHICGSFIPVVDGYDCPECGEFTCEDCFDSKYRVCNSCVSLALKKNEEKFIEALKEFLKDGIIDANERKEIESLKVKYGISTEKANALEQELKPKTEKINFSTIEKLNLNEATEVFYEQGIAKKSYELLEPIYKAHPYSEEVLNIYLPVLIKTDIEEAKKIISKSNIDILSMYMAEIEIAIIEKDLDLAERKLKQAKQLWQSNKLKYYEAWYYLELAKFTGKNTFVSNAEEVANNFDATEDKLELCYQIKILKNIAEYKGEDTSFYTEEFCKENNLYTGVVLGVKKITVGKDRDVQSLKKALEIIDENGTIILEPGVYKEHLNFDKKVKIVGISDSIFEKSSSELPIVVLDSTQNCEITATVEIEGVVFTHDEDLYFSNLKKYAEDYSVDSDYEFRFSEPIFMLGVDCDSKLRNIAVLGAKDYGVALGKGELTDSILANCCVNILCLYDSKIENCILGNCREAGILVLEKANPVVKDCDIRGEGKGICILGNASGSFINCEISGLCNSLFLDEFSTPSFINCKVLPSLNGSIIKGNSNPILKDCDFLGSGIYVEGQASGTFEGCRIHDIGEHNGLKISGSATPSFVDCKIHDNKEAYALVYVLETANPSLKNCEVYNGRGIYVENQASGTFEGCRIHDIGENNGLNIQGSATPSFVDCKIHHNTKYALVAVCGTSNPSLKNCEVYNGAGNSIFVEGQASGTFEGCHIYDIGENNGLYIKGSATPSFVDCKIHHNTKYALVYVGETANPSLKNCEVYKGAGSGIAVEGQARGTYTKCYIHNNIGENFYIKTSKNIDTSTCRMG